jgi:hypothetical protein
VTDQQTRQIDEQINAFGWTYNPRSEQFETMPKGSAAPSPVAWEDIIVAVPDLSLNALMEYEERKQREWQRAARKAFAA